MSRYIRILNAIKSNIATLALTPSQLACQRLIKERLVYPGVVNLYGPHGVGKTLLGWAMANAGEVTYIVHPSRLEELNLTDAPFAFVDNATEERSAFRRIVGTLELAGIERVIIVTHLPADDYVFRAELKLTEEDIETVRKNLNRLGYAAPEVTWNNLWYGLLQSAKGGQ